MRFPLVAVQSSEFVQGTTAPVGQGWRVLTLACGHTVRVKVSALVSKQARCRACYVVDRPFSIFTTLERHAS